MDLWVMLIVAGLWLATWLLLKLCAALAERP